MNDMNDRTYSLKEVADVICGDDLKLPERWVMRRIREGKFRALKVGRTYRMTQQQVDDALKALESGTSDTRPPEPPKKGTATANGFIIDELLMTPTSRRRRQRRS